MWSRAEDPSTLQRGLTPDGSVSFLLAFVARSYLEFIGPWATPVPGLSAAFSESLIPSTRALSK